MGEENNWMDFDNSVYFTTDFCAENRIEYAIMIIRENKEDTQEFM